MWYLISSGSKSLTVEPSSTLPCRLMAPVANRSASASVVLPEPLWPTRATLRMPVNGQLVRTVLAGWTGPAGSGSACPTRATSVALMAARQLASGDGASCRRRLSLLGRSAAQHHPHFTL